MELKNDELRTEARPLWETEPGVESVTEELDPIDIEILLTSGHYDDCCIS